MLGYGMLNRFYTRVAPNLTFSNSAEAEFGQIRPKPNLAEFRNSNSAEAEFG